MSSAAHVQEIFGSRGGEMVDGRESEALAGVDAGPESQGRAIVVASPKGGVGKSTIAVNLALFLALEEPRQVVLVDLDAQFGDVAAILDFEPVRDIVDGISALESHDQVLFKTYLHAHPSGLMVLAAPDRPTRADHVTADRARHLVRHLTSIFRFVIVDTSAGIGESNIGALEAADEVILIGTPDVPALRAMLNEIEVFDQLGVTKARRLVVNLTDRRTGILAKDVERSVGLRATASIPRDLEVALAVNQGQPMAIAKKLCDPAQRLRALAAKIAKEKR